MKFKYELLYFIEKVILRNKPLLDKTFDERETLEYNRLKNENDKSESFHLSSSFLDKCFNATLSFIPDKKAFNKRQRGLINLLRKQTTAKILNNLQARNSSMELYESVYKEGIGLKNIDAIIESSRKLFFHNGVYEGKVEKAHQYYESCNEALKKMQYEILAEWYYTEFAGLYAKKKFVPSEKTKKAIGYFEELTNIDENYKTSRFYQIYFALALVVFEPNFQFERIKEIFEGGISLFDVKYNEQTFQRIFLRTSLIPYLIKLEELDVAILRCEECIKMSKIQSSSWLRILELKVYCLLRKMDILEANKIMGKIRSSSIYKTTSLEKKIRIELLNNYLVIFSALFYKGFYTTRKLKLAKYLNSIPEYNTDKKAMNIPIIILQILYYILKRNDEMLEKRFEAINKYLSRYLKADTYYRSHCFIKMLLQVHRQNFHPVAIERHTKKYKDKLNLVTLKQSKEPIEIEIVRYEDLWEAILKYFEKAKVV